MTDVPDVRSDAFLRVRFSLRDEQDSLLDSTTASLEIREFVDLVDDVSRALVIFEAGNLLDELELSGEARLDAMRAFDRSQRQFAAAAELTDLRMGSVELEITIQAREIVVAAIAVAGFVLKDVVGEAWEGSPARAGLVAFFERAFGGSRRKAEEASIAASTRRARTQQAVEVRQPPSGTEETVLLEVIVRKRSVRKAFRGDWEAADSEVRRILGG